MQPPRCLTALVATFAVLFAVLATQCDASTDYRFRYQLTLKNLLNPLNNHTMVATVGEPKITDVHSGCGNNNQACVWYAVGSCKSPTSSSIMTNHSEALFDPLEYTTIMMNGNGTENIFWSFLGFTWYANHC